ncbi:hypothetical protein [Clostridium botulinum]|uniref:hypothetical protein n=1 Tax=Clostridium botulinum TaxID=1491 RepID=UPI0004D9A547|nr:hypothetical protein [Clostridium botulinum]KEH90512.1 hypothetical protein Z963_p0070 [Clostridium botulinum C/D str. It1]
MARPNTLTVSFSKKNLDVKNLIDNKKEQIEGFEHSQYVCDAIRFYEKYKDKEFNNINKDEIIRLVDERFEKLKEQLISNEVVVSLTDEKEKFNDAILEENIENINPAFLDED